MPEQPPAKRQRTFEPIRQPDPVIPYAELHCKTNFSFLEGASHPDELVQEAARLNLQALAVTDRNSLAGVVRAHTAAKQLNLKLLIGAEIVPADGPPVVLLATDRPAYARLSRLITRGRRRAEKGQCLLHFDDIAEFSEGLLALVPARLLLAAHSEQPTQTLRLRKGEEQQLGTYRDLFGDRCYLLAELHYGPDDAQRLRWWERLSQRARVPMVAGNDVHFHVSQRKALHDVVTAIRLGITVADANEHLFANAERYLKSAEQMAVLFADYPHAVRRTVEVAQRGTFSLDELRYEYPEELCPHGMTPLQHLQKLTWKGAHERYPRGIPEKVRRLVEHELRLIEELRYEAYFLTVWDLVRFARSRNILCQGRGSAANSAVCFCLGVTSVDPERIDVLFERFVSRERNEAPDIDVDFEHERREEVLQYLYEKYGRERTGMTAEVITYRPRSAIRDVGKALGLSLDRVDALAKTLEGFHEEKILKQRLREAGVNPESPVILRLLALVNELLGFPRHLSQHVGGMVMTRGPLCELVPIENAAMADRTVIQWDKDDLDDLGILKVDCLALGMLTAIRRCFDLIALHWGRKFTLANIPAEDPAVYAMVSRADTVGVFQIESRAQMSMLPRLKPRCFYDLVIEVAIVRPGPIQGEMVHPYLRRRAKQETVEYPNEEIRQVLEKTLGVPLFQEQAMRLAMVAAGFSPGEADQLRRAMGGWRRPGLIEKFRQRLIDGMKRNGFDDDYAERVFRQIQGFGEYGFPESHAASFALLVYVSAWLKRYYPAAFTAALLNSQPMGFYAPAQLIRDARDHGVEVLQVDVNHSDWDCMLEEIEEEISLEKPGPVLDAAHRRLEKTERPPAPMHHRTTHKRLALRLGFRLLLGLSKSHAEAIVAARANGKFRTLEEFGRRTQLTKPVLERLAKADAFGSLGLDRRNALWDALEPQQSLPLFETGDCSQVEDSAPPLVPMSAHEEVVADYQTVGLSLKDHPLKFVRRELEALGAVPSTQLRVWPNHRFVRVGGIVLLRQRPSTANGIRFVTLEDEVGQANLIVRPSVWEKYRRAASGAAALLASGQLQRHEGVIHVLVTKLEDLSVLVRGLRVRSRDFR